MDNNFTTTFIPKKPVVPEAAAGDRRPVSRPVGFLSTISTVLFFITLLLAGGVYLWEKSTQAKVKVLEDSIAKIEDSFEPELIQRLQSLDRQLKNGNMVLKNHVVTTPIFDLLESATLKQIRFTKFDLKNDEAKGMVVRMSGEADSYRSIAQEADVLGTNVYLKDILFSNFFLTPKGKISFDLSFSVRPDFVDFEKAPLAVTQAADTTPVDSGEAPTP